MSRFASPAVALAATLALVHWYGDSVRAGDLWSLPGAGGVSSPGVGGPSGPAGAVEIPPYMVLVGALGPISTVFISRALGLGLGTDLLLGTVRVAVQLSALGAILGPVFRIDRVPLSIVYTLFMLSVASVEAASRPTQSYRGATRDAAVSLLLPASVVLAFGIGVVVRPSPFLWSAQYFIPVAGMLLGNSCTAVAMAMSSMLNELASSKDLIEANLAAGASRVEASRHIIQKACRVGLNPSINQMNVAGIVAIPGLMTGQILGGADPMRAARYQIVLLFFIVATSGASSALASIFVARAILDRDNRLRLDRLETRQYEKGVAGFVEYLVETLWHGIFKSKRAIERAVQGNDGEQATDETLRTPLLGATPEGSSETPTSKNHTQESDLDAVERGDAPPLREATEEPQHGLDDGASAANGEAQARAQEDSKEASTDKGPKEETPTDAHAAKEGSTEVSVEPSTAAQTEETTADSTTTEASAPPADSAAQEASAPTLASSGQSGGPAASQAKSKRGKGKRPKGRR